MVDWEGTVAWLPASYHLQRNRVFLRILASNSHYTDVPAESSGINKPFDRIFKDFADEAPKLFLSLTGVVPRGVKATIKPLRTETAPPVALPDYVAVVRIGVRKFITHAEFESSYHPTIPIDMARYGGSLAWQYLREVVSVLVLLRPKGVPESIPRVGHYKIGVTETKHRYKVVRLWDLDPTPVLKTGNPRLLPWALLMKSSDEQVRAIASAVASQEDDEAVARFLILGNVRYDRSTLNGMLGDRRMSGFIKAYLDASLTVRELRAESQKKGRKQGEREGLKKGLKRGLQEGRAEGQTGEARKLLRIGLRAKFPELGHVAEIDRISSVEKLEVLIGQVFRSNDERSIYRAILAAAANLN
jgi:predicted transposase YdaD